MDKLNLYWGDFHKHLTDFDRVDEIIEDAKYNLDFYPVLEYPFEWYHAKGARVESVRNKPEFLEMWKRLQRAAREHHDPGRFVTFLGYEWHGNRTHWGDHNVILDDSWDLEDLYANLRTRRALAIPHHTAYMAHHRGKDWSVLDENLSPVMEIHSGHGCSESIDSPVPLKANVSMGPRLSGGTYVDALNRGLRLGCIASNDGSGLAGTWGRGVAGLWATELTREALWEALLQRRTIGSTGDRIELMLKVDDCLMGGVVEAKREVTAEIEVTCAQPLDRLELIHNGVVIDTYNHRGKWEKSRPGAGKCRLLFECGWGPSPGYGFKNVLMKWKGAVEVQGGRILSALPRFTHFGQRYEVESDSRCTFAFQTTRDPAIHAIQGLILELVGDLDTRLSFDVDGHQFAYALRDLSDRITLLPLMEESEQRILQEFGLKKGEEENPDIFYHTARKVRLSPPWPEASYRADVRFEKLPLAEGRNYFYVRATQIDGEVAWSSPVWVENRG
jgi:hypothetical protein